MPRDAKNMYDIPMGVQKPESPHPPFAPFVNIAPRHELKHAGYFAWRTHGTTDWLLKHTIAGHGRFGHAQGEVISDAGDTMLLRPGTPHDYGTASRDGHDDNGHDHAFWEVIWAHFRPRAEWLEWLHWPEEAPGLMRLHIADLTDRKRIERQLFDMNRLARSDSARREALAMNALEKAILLYDQHNPIFAEQSTDPRVLAAMNHLREHLTKKFDASACVAASGLSQSRLYHLFQQQVSQSPQEYLELLRIEKAKHLLERTRKAVQTIALELGFADPLYFSRRFKHRTGFSPRDYREAMPNRNQGEIVEGISGPS
jgi:AraC family transcriptional regulator, arabinose operon regulatory protein